MEDEKPTERRPPRANTAPESATLFPSVLKGLKELYATKIRPIEEKYKYEEYFSAPLRDSDFDAKPMVLLMGQYSTGKTSFIEYIIQKEFPGERVGPEPTTDRFVAVMHGATDRTIPGNAVSVASDKPFYALNKFGSGFLSKFEAAECDAPILQNLTFVDTPGVLSGEKQRIGRSYDFISVCEWFAERADLILLLFDAHKLDISDEFKGVIESLKGHDDKIRVVLNKADMISQQQLMRVYGALMWSLGKVVKTPEVMRVYLGSFWDQPYKNENNKHLFEIEQKDLIKDLEALPRNAAVRKINDLVKRARLVRVHALIIGTLKAKMPSLFGKESAKTDLIAKLLDIYKEIKRTHHLPVGDFPPVEKMQGLLKEQDFTQFPKIDLKMLQCIEDVLTKDLPALMVKIAPPDSKENVSRDDDLNPFIEESGDYNIVFAEKERSKESFFNLAPEEVNGKVKLSGVKLKSTLMESGVDKLLLRKIWDLSDIDKDGHLDLEEYILIVHLIDLAKRAPKKIPEKLPEGLIPASKKAYF